MPSNFRCLIDISFTNSPATFFSFFRFISTPIDLIILKNSNLVGFDNIFFNIKVDFGNIDAAPAKKAADDGSPGISILSGLRA